MFSSQIGSEFGRHINTVVENHGYPTARSELKLVGTDFRSNSRVRAQRQKKSSIKEWFFVRPDVIRKVILGGKGGV